MPENALSLLCFLSDLAAPRSSLPPLVDAHIPIDDRSPSPYIRVPAGGLSTTIHITVDAPGNSARLVLTGVGRVADITRARSQIEGLRTEAMIGNKGCDAEQLKKFFRMATRHDT